jgi:hypothetical protein
MCGAAHHAGRKAMKRSGDPPATKIVVDDFEAVLVSKADVV